MRLSMFGISSKKTIRNVDSPVTRAAWMKSRSCRVSAWPRRILVSIAQLVNPMIGGHDPRPGLVEEGRDHDQERQGRDDEEDVRHEIDAVVDETPAVGGEAVRE